MKVGLGLTLPPYSKRAFFWLSESVIHVNGTQIFSNLDFREVWVQLQTHQYHTPCIGLSKNRSAADEKQHLASILARQ